MPDAKVLVDSHRERGPLEAWYLRWRDSAVGSALAVFRYSGWRRGSTGAGDLVHDPGQWGPGPYDAEDIFHDLVVTALKTPVLLEKTAESQGAFLHVAARNRAIDNVRAMRRHRSLDDLLTDDIDGGRRDDVLAHLGGSWRDSSSLMAPSAEDDFTAGQAKRAEEAHARLNACFTKRVRRRLLGRSGREPRLRRSLSTGARPAILRELLGRPSILATLLYPGPRNTYPGAAEEAERLARETGRSVGRIRNLRTELIDLLRKELAEEIRAVLCRLADLWDTTPEQAAELHLRWAEGL